MEKERFQRAHLRAPLKTKVLYWAGPDVFKALALNISKGGILLKNLPSPPNIQPIPLMFSLTHYPELNQMGSEAIKNLSLSSLSRSVVRIEAQIARHSKEGPPRNKSFTSRVALKFISEDSQNKEQIENYVRIFSKNLVFFLGLFEGKGISGDPKLVLKKVAEILGHNPKGELNMIRLAALHEYQSLRADKGLLSHRGEL